MDDSHDIRRGGAPEPGPVIRLRQATSVRGPVPTPEVSGAPALAGADPICARDLFTLVWHALADILGTAAAAALLRRAARRAAARSPELATLSITRDSLEYHYTLPATWSAPVAVPAPALCELINELCVLLVDLTGPVVIQRLEQIPELRDRGMIPRQEVQS